MKNTLLRLVRRFTKPTEEEWASMNLEQRFAVAMTREWVPLNNQAGAGQYQKIQARPSEITVVRRTPAVIYVMVKGVRHEQAFTIYYQDQIWE